jgi:hypothetical protein
MNKGKWMVMMLLGAALVIGSAVTASAAKQEMSKSRAKVELAAKPEAKPEGP